MTEKKKRHYTPEGLERRRQVGKECHKKINEDSRKAAIKAYWEKVRNDPELREKVRAEKSARAKKQWAEADKETRKKWEEIASQKLKRYHYWKMNPPEEDFWARNNKSYLHRKRVNHTRKKLASLGLDVIPTTTGNVTDEYLDEIDDFFAEIW